MRKYLEIIEGGKVERVNFNILDLDQVTASHFRLMQSTDGGVTAWLKVFTSIPYDIIDLLNESQQLNIASASPMFDWDKLQIEEPKMRVEVGHRSYGQFENVRSILKGGLNPFWYIPELVSIYRIRSVGDSEPAGNFIGAGLYIISSFQAHIQKFSGLDSDYEPEEIEAGIRDFESLGSFPGIDTLAGGDPLKYDDILKKLPADVAFMKFLLEKMRRNYQTNLLEIRRTKNTSSNGVPRTD